MLKLAVQLFIVFILSACNNTSKNHKIKTMSYNIHYGMDSNYSNRGNNSALNQVIEYVDKYDLDIVLLQEFPHGKKKFASYLEGEQKKPIAYIKSKLGNTYHISEAISRDGNKFIGGKSLVIISRFPIIKIFILDLPKPMWHQTRKVLLVKLKIDNKILWIANNHLYYDKNIINYNDLIASLNWIKKKVPLQDSLIFGGDLNFDEIIDTVKKYKELTKNTDGISKYNIIKNQGFNDSYYTHDLTKEIKSRHTFISDERKPDYLFFKNIACYTYFHGDSNRSDHYPIFAEFYFKDE